jgi:uncharacterized protein YjbJ (UPF0337 family)
MTSNENDNLDDKATEARQSILTSLKGRAKEVAGAITRNDSLITEGQLEQTEAREQREANAAQALADAKRDAAQRTLTAQTQQAAAQKLDVQQQAAREKAAATAEEQARVRAVEDQAARQKLLDTARADAEAAREAREVTARAAGDKRAAASKEREAAAKHDREQASAQAAQKAADRARAEAEELNKDAGIA